MAEEKRGVAMFKEARECLYGSQAASTPEVKIHFCKTTCQCEANQRNEHETERRTNDEPNKWKVIPPKWNKKTEKPQKEKNQDCTVKGPCYSVDHIMHCLPLRREPVVDVVAVREERNIQELRSSETPYEENSFFELNVETRGILGWFCSCTSVSSCLAVKYSPFMLQCATADVAASPLCNCWKSPDATCVVEGKEWYCRG